MTNSKDTRPPQPDSVVEAIAELVHDAMVYGAECGGTPERWQGGNSLAEDEARRQARKIIALTQSTKPAPAPGLVEAVAPFLALLQDARECGHDSGSSCTWRIAFDDLEALEKALSTTPAPTELQHNYDSGAESVGGVQIDPAPTGLAGELAKVLDNIDRSKVKDGTFAIAMQAAARWVKLKGPEILTALQPTESEAVKLLRRGYMAGVEDAAAMAEVHEMRGDIAKSIRKLEKDPLNRIDTLTKETDRG